jgi:hypothetical protein
MLRPDVLCSAEESALVTFREVLLDLMDLPGANYSCVADRVSGTLLGEVGASSVAPGVVMEWGGGAAAFLATAPGDGLDDLMITSHRSYHLVRPVAADPSRWLMIYLCLDRGRSNLAVARRELASPTLHKRIAVASVGPPPSAVDPPGASPRRPVPATRPVPGPAARNGASPAVALLSWAPAPGRDVPGATRAATPPRAAVRAGEPLGGARSDTRLAPSPVPLPRRGGPSRVPPPAPTEPATVVEQVPVRSWATDVATMRRLLAALRSLR